MLPYVFNEENQLQANTNHITSRWRNDAQKPRAPQLKRYDQKNSC
jgi:hypothetical protein